MVSEQPQARLLQADGTPRRARARLRTSNFSFLHNLDDRLFLPFHRLVQPERFLPSPSRNAAVALPSASSIGFFLRRSRSLSSQKAFPPGSRARLPALCSHEWSRRWYRRYVQARGKTPGGRAAERSSPFPRRLRGQDFGSTAGPRQDSLPDAVT